MNEWRWWLQLRRRRGRGRKMYKETRQKLKISENFRIQPSILSGYDGGWKKLRTLCQSIYEVNCESMCVCAWLWETVFLSFINEIIMTMMMMMIIFDWELTEMMTRSGFILKLIFVCTFGWKKGSFKRLILFVHLFFTNQAIMSNFNLTGG